eukprot:sb/3475536/
MPTVRNGVTFDFPVVDPAGEDWDEGGYLGFPWIPGSLWFSGLYWPSFAGKGGVTSLPTVNRESGTWVIVFIHDHRCYQLFFSSLKNTIIKCNNVRFYYAYKFYLATYNTRPKVECYKCNNNDPRP